MSATPNNSSLAEGLTGPARPAPNRTEPYTSGHEALQALLAFSSLHEQIRQRRAQEKLNGGPLTPENAWRLEQFVLDEVLQLVAERALSITGADGVAVALAEEDEIVCRGTAGSIAPDAGARLDPNAGFSGACLVSGQIVRCDDSESDSRVDMLACRRLGARSMVAVPLSAKQHVIGLLEAFSSEPYGFNDSDVRSLNLLAELILSAMRPEEEDRLAEISKRVVSQAVLVVEPRALTGTKQPLGLSELVARPEEPVAIEESGGPAVIAKLERIESSRPGLAVVIAVVLVAVALGAGVWWSIRRHPSAAATNTHSVIRTLPPQGVRSANSTMSSSTAPPVESGSIVATVDGSGLLPTVRGIRHWGSKGSSTVVIDLEEQIQYEAHRLTNPERIYFDLHDTRMADGLSGKRIDVDDELLRRIRVAQPMEGVTRVVLETKDASDFSVSLESNPYRLVVEVRKFGVKPRAHAEIDLFGTSNKSSRASQQVAAAMTPEGANVHARPPKVKIALDAGHGGWDMGTVGRRGLLEKDLVLDIVTRLGNLIESRLGAEVTYTRKDDSYVALERRAEIANLARADLFLSIHANYSDYASARGVETYYTNTYSSVKARPRESDEVQPAMQDLNWTNVDIREKVHESRRFASSVQHALYATLAEKNSGLRNRGVKEAQYVVLTGTSMPAILAEVSFVSSPADETNLQSAIYRQQIAEAVYKGIARYVEESKGVNIASASGKSAAR